MTRTIKKWLLAVLLFIMAISISFATLTMFSGARADETETGTTEGTETGSSSEAVDAFKGYIDKFIALGEAATPKINFKSATFEKDAAVTKLIFGDDAAWADESASAASLAKYKPIWTNYSNARKYYTNSNTNSEIVADATLAEEGYIQAYTNISSVFSSAYSITVNINVNMFSIYMGIDLEQNNKPVALTYASNAEVVALKAEYEKLSAGEKQYVMADTTLTDTDGADLPLFYLKKVEKMMEARKDQIDAAIVAIKAIKYEGRTDGGADYTGTEAQTIGLVSGPSIRYAEDLIKTESYDLKIDKAYFVVEDETDADGNLINYYDVYEKALNTLNAMTEDADAIIRDIEAIMAEADKGVKYYTLRSDVLDDDGEVVFKGFDTVKAEYDQFKDDHDGDWENGYFIATASNAMGFFIGKEADLDENGELQYDENGILKVKNTKGMLQYLEDIKGKIDAVVALIEAIKDVDVKYVAPVKNEDGTYNYERTTGDYYLAIYAAEEAFNNLYKLTEDGTEYKDIFNHDEALYTSEATTGYIVSNYAYLKDARAQIDAWDETITDLVEKVNDLVPRVETENILKKYTTITDTVATLTPEQLKDFNARTVTSLTLYGKTETTAGPVLALLNTYMTQIDNKASSMDKAINRVYDEYKNFTAESREEIAKLFAEYTKLDDTSKTYVTSANRLLEMYAHVAHSKDLLKAWYDAVQDCKTFVTGPIIMTGTELTIAEWEKIKVAYDAYAALEKVTVSYVDADGNTVEEGTLEVNLQNYLKALLPPAAPEEPAEGEEPGETETPEVPVVVTEADLDAKYYVAYNEVYQHAHKAMDTIVVLAADMNPDMDKGIVINPNLPVEDTTEWENKVTPILARYDKLSAAAKDYFVYAYEVIHTQKYLQAKALIPQYRAEGTISAIWKPVLKDGSEVEAVDGKPVYGGTINFLTNVEDDEKAFVTLAVGQRVLTAIKSYLEYNGEIEADAKLTNEALYEKFDAYIATINGEYGAIRNARYLVAARDQLKNITLLLDAWMTRAATAIADADEDGYGLNLDKVYKVLFSSEVVNGTTIPGYADLVGGKWTVVTEDEDGQLQIPASAPEGAVVVKIYTRATVDAKTTWVPTYYVLEHKDAENDIVIDSDKEGYVLEAYLAIFAVEDPADEETFDGVIALNDKLITSINGRITSLLDTKEEDRDQTFYDTFGSVQTDYAKLSESQKLLVKGYADLRKLAEDLLAYTNSQKFKAFLNALYAQVVEGGEKKVENEFVLVYVDLLDFIYDAFDPETQALIDDDYLTTTLDAIREAYVADDNTGSGDLDELKTEVAGLKTEVAGLKTKIEALENDTTNADKIAAAEEAIAGLKTEVAGLNTKIEALEADNTTNKAAIEELKTKLATAEGNVTALQTALAAAEKTIAGHTTEIAGLKADLETATAELAKVDGKISKAIEDAKTELTNKLNTEINKLDTALKALIDTETKAREDGDKATEDKIAEEIKKVNAAIEAAKKSLVDNEIKTLTDGLATASKAATDATANVTAMKEELNKTNSKVTELETANAELDKQVKDLEGRLGGMVAGIVIVGILTGVAMAGVVFVFLKKKN